MYFDSAHRWRNVFLFLLLQRVRHAGIERQDRDFQQLLLRQFHRRRLNLDAVDLLDRLADAAAEQQGGRQQAVHGEALRHWQCLEGDHCFFL